MKKGLIILVHIFGILLVLFGVGLQPNAAEEGKTKFTGELEKNAVIRVLENDTAIKQGYLSELLEAFNEEYKEYGIVARDANMDQYSDLENDGPYGYGPDVLYQANDRLMRYVDGKHIQPLPVEDLETFQALNNSAWDPFQSVVNGKEYTFAVPVNLQGPLLYYRKDLLPENWETEYDENGNGVPDMIESWNHLYNFSKERIEEGKWGYMRSFLEPYFSIGYLYSYGGYAFGNNDTDDTDIGFSKGNSELGASVIRQLAGIMDERCIDDTITVTAYSQLAKGNFFATITTPDVYTLFIDQMIAEGMSKKEAVDNLGIADIPLLPKSGDLSETITDWDSQLMSSIMMGGIQGYAISSYTKYPNASLAFIDFATKYEMIYRRNELLGIAPARFDVAEAVGGLSEIINQNLTNGLISVMPSIRATAQIWTPLQTFFQDVAKDPFRTGSQSSKYTSLEAFKKELEKVDKQIYDAIHTLN